MKKSLILIFSILIGFCANYLNSTAYFDNCPGGQGIWVPLLYPAECTSVSPQNLCDITCQVFNYKDSCAIKAAHCIKNNERMCWCRR